MAQQSGTRNPSLGIILQNIGDVFEKGGIYIALLLVLLVAGVLSPVFYQSSNLLNVLRQASALGILSIGQTIVMIGGGIDLSVASIMQLATIGVAEIAQGQNERVVFAILAVLGMSAGVGLINGVLVTRFRVPAFVGTLFVGVVISGLRLVYTNATPSGVLPTAVRLLGRDSTGPVPNAALIFAGLAVVADLILSRTTYGRKLYATGGNTRTAWLSGVHVDRIRMGTYVLSGLLAGFAGLVLAGYVGYADQWLGRGYELDSIAAVVIGGTSLAGGKGTIRGTIAGVLLVTVLLNLVLLLNLNVQYQLVVKGLVIIFAVGLYSFRRRG